MTVGAALSRAADDLGARGVESPGVDAEWLLAGVLGVSRSELALARARELTTSERAAFDELVERRAAREPLAYVLGEWAFRRLTLKVDRRALVPRPEEEVVVERCLARVSQKRAPRILDVGVGSGAIALALADEHPEASVTAVDVSRDALALARENAAATGLAGRVAFLERDVHAGLPAGPWDLIVSNPPYVGAEELQALAPEVREWEPRRAVVAAGQTEAVAAAARGLLAPSGWLVLETHWHGAREVAATLRELGYADVTISRDLAGRERVVEGRQP